MPELTQREFTQLKSKLTRAKNTKDPDKITKACDEAFAVFEAKGYPDNWHMWERAKDDAQTLRRHQAVDKCSSFGQGLY